MASLLETALFYQVTMASYTSPSSSPSPGPALLLVSALQESCEGAGDSILDLVDYCHRRLVHLLAQEAWQEGEGPGRVVEEVEEEGSEEEEEEEEEKRKIIEVRNAPLPLLVPSLISCHAPLPLPLHRS